jgi:hypothetical protein
MPRALIFTDGKLVSWMSVDVTYAISGFLPIKMVSRASVDITETRAGFQFKVRAPFVEIAAIGTLDCPWMSGTALGKTDHGQIAGRAPRHQ